MKKFKNLFYESVYLLENGKFANKDKIMFDPINTIFNLKNDLNEDLQLTIYFSPENKQVCYHIVKTTEKLEITVEDYYFKNTNKIDFKKTKKQIKPNEVINFK